MQLRLLLREVSLSLKVYTVYMYKTTTYFPVITNEDTRYYIKHNEALEDAI